MVREGGVREVMAGDGRCEVMAGVAHIDCIVPKSAL